MRYIIAAFFFFLVFTNASNPMFNYLEKNRPFWMASDIATSTQAVDSTLTVVSFNIQFGLNLDQAFAELTDGPYHGADIILLQEMDERGTIYLSEKLCYNYIYYPISVHNKNRKNFGNAILSRWPILQPEKLLLPHEQPLSKIRRGVTSAVIQYGDIDIKAYSIHLETPVMSRVKRLDQLKSTIDNINEVDHTEMIIAGGDFNSLFPKDVDEMVNLCRVNNLDWNTECVGHTLKRFNVIKPTLDHIFSKGFDLVDAGKLDNWTASDHSPIWATLKVLNNGV